MIYQFTKIEMYIMINSNKGVAWMKKILVFILICFLSVSYAYAAAENPKYKYTKTAMPTNTKDLIEDVKKKIQQNPTDVRGYMFLGVTYEQDGQVDNAIATYRKATQVDPKYAGAYEALGMALGKNGKPGEALVEFEKARSLDPKSWGIITNLASTHLMLKSYDKAIELYKQAIDANPKEIKTKIRLAQCYMMAGKDEDAIVVYEAVLKERPDLTQFEQNLDQLYKKVGRERKSGTAYEVKKSMEEQGYHASVQQVGNVITVAPTYYEKGKAPITDLEMKVNEEYKKRVGEATANLPAGQDRQKVINSIAREIAQKYNMTDENFTYMTLKIEYNEVVPDTYISPSEKPVTMKDVGKEKYETMTPAERTAVVKGWNTETDIEKILQKALMSESKGDFKDAAILYNQVLISKDTEEDIRIGMHSALQRCYEKTKDASSEKTELIWINDNILASNGKYNHMAQYLTNLVKNHLRERMARFGIKPN